MKKIIITLLFPVFALAQSTDQNFVKTTTYRGAGATLPQTQVTYFDGLGRPIQKVANAQSNTGKDIVTHIEYDAFGRQVKDYLPYPTTQNTMQFQDPMIAQSNTLNYYQGQFNDATAYSEKLFENSPLDRVFKQAAPGDAWAMNGGHEIKFDYQTNVDSGVNAVNLYQVTTTWNASKLLYDTNITQNSVYSANQLYLTITKDENWISGKNHTTEEFKDKEGRVVLKRTYADILDPVTGAVTTPQAQHNTYYVYDAYGNLTYVLPPLTEGTTTQTVLDGLCYQYKYDHRNRLVAKKLPGKQWEFIVYDNLDRPVATGPAKQPWGNETWGCLITEYDVFGRVTQTGWKNIVLNETSRGGYQSNIQAGTNPFVLTTNDILTKNYYDSYTYPNAPSVPSQIEGQDVATNVKGLATGSWVRVLDNIANQNGELSYTFYDKKYRPVQTYSKNYLGGSTQVNSKLDFMGKTLYTITTHKRTSSDTDIITRDDFTYSAQDRLTLHTQTMNGTTQTIVANTYDELGQLTSKKVGGDGTTPLQKVDYTYNIRGWLEAINDVTALKDPNEIDPIDLFAFKINYNNPTGNTKPLFNGNISETYWRSAYDDLQRKYEYGYDALNRLLTADFSKPENAVTTNSYKEHLQYDKNGNILSLKRNGIYEDDNYEYEIDNLTYTYDHINKNQLKEVYDETGWQEGFVDEKAPDSIDYTYDDNGNMRSDFNKNITSITYNHLNLPVKILFNGNELTKIEYLYDGTGRKLEKKVFLMKRVQVVCGGGGGSSESKSASTASVVPMCYTYVPGTDTTNYLQGGYQYKNNMLQFFPHAEGYVQYQDGSGFYYVYNITDHLGNVRVSYQDNGGDPMIIEENNYYAFGLKHKGYNDLGNTSNKFRFNNREFQDELGLNTTAMDYRQYDGALGRFNSIDLLSEDAFEITPYRFAMNNPIFWSDPTGLFETRKEAREYRREHGISGKISKDSDGSFSISDKKNGVAYTKGDDSGMTNMDSHDNDGVIESVLVERSIAAKSIKPDTKADGIGLKDVPGLALDFYDMRINTNLSNGFYVNASGNLASYMNLKNFKPGLSLAQQGNLSKAFTGYRTLGSTLSFTTKALPLVQLAYSEGSYELSNKSKQEKDNRNFTRITTTFGFCGPVGWGMGVFLQANQYIPVEYTNSVNSGRNYDNWNSYVK